MPDLTPQQLETLRVYSRANRSAYPPVAIGGIGKEPFALVPSVFGGLSVIGAAADQPLGTTPEKLTGFAQLVPDFSTSGIYPEGLIPNASNDEIQVLQGGVYLANVRLNAAITTGAAYRFEIYVNDVASGVFTAQDLSNQSGFLSSVLISPVKVLGGDLVSIYGNADSAARTFTMQDSSIFFTMIR